MNSVPPKISATPAPVRWPGILLVVLALAGVGMVFFFNPATHSFYPGCTFHQLTGLNCPGCGMTRAFYALLHGHFASALRDNGLLIAALAALTVRGVWLAVQKLKGRPAGEFFPAKFLWPLLVVAVVFTVLRNLPSFAFLSP
jgi:hypothetical protein